VVVHWALIVHSVHSLATVEKYRHIKQEKQVREKASMSNDYKVIFFIISMSLLNLLLSLYPPG
jgi:hypothetical protein